jgi:hypothetical protein
MIPNLELHTKLSNLFHIGFNFITAENNPKPKWRTNRKYRLTRGEFVKRYSDELTLLGVSFGAATKYFMLDIDFASKYHPDNDPTALPKIRQLLEKVGIVRTDLIRSSHSGGIHLYGFFPKNVSTIRLATLLHVTLIDAGFEIAKGQLECFPNPKPYGEKGHFTYYNPHRVLLQPNSGGFLLDEDGNILLSAENLTHENMLAGFLVRAEQSAQAQDMDLLRRMMDTCYAKYTSNAGIAKYQHHHKDYTEVAREWKENLELTIQNIYNTEEFNCHDLQSEEVAKISHGSEINNDLESQIEIEPDSAPVSSISIGTKLRRNVQQIGRKTYPALANCQVVSANGLDWVVRDREGYSWNVSHHALASGVWEIERDEANVVDVGIRPVVEIASQMRINLGSIPDALLLEFLHHPDLEEIQGTMELADELMAACSRQQVEALVSNLSRCQKLDLWRVLSVEERAAVETLMAQPPLDLSSVIEVEESVEGISNCSVSKLVTGVTVNTLTGLVGVIKHVFESMSKPFLVYHESLGRTILYESDALRLAN